MAGLTHDTHPEEILPIYFKEEYISVHGNNNIHNFKTNRFIYVTSLKDDVAYSFGKSPFGSIIVNQPVDFQQFKKFELETNEVLKKRGVRKIIIRHPPEYYSSFIDPDWLLKTGYKLVTKDVNQFIELNLHPEKNLHQMEMRKLNQAEKQGFRFTKDPSTKLDEIHDFISLCREDAGLKINITLNKLMELFDTFPLQYGIYSIRKNQQIVATCIISRPVRDIYYYYLPATHPKHRNKSPMVLLMVSLMEDLKSRGAKILDLGLSSIDGKKQSGLYAFKERMGARETPSLVFEKDLT